MIRTPLTVIVALRELARLEAVHRRPEHYPADNAALARQFVELCADVSAEAFTAAVTAYLQSPARYFPKPGEIRALAREQPRRAALVAARAFRALRRRGYRGG